MMLIFLSIIPLVFSLDRGAWLSASLALLYSVGRLLLSGRKRSTSTVAVIVALSVVSVVLVATPLKDVVLVRIDRGYGDDDRWYLYSESIRLARESPLVGFGAPVDVPNLPSIGTHGHLWTVLVSFGFVGLTLFLGWMITALFATWKGRPGATKREESARFWTHVVIFTAIVQMPYYELLPWGLPIVMIAAAAAWRERLPAVYQVDVSRSGGRGGVVRTPRGRPT
jgi:O-antigen ligase